jgi:hypothetical protein
MNVESLTPITREASLEEKVAFLASGAGFSGDVPTVASRDPYVVGVSCRRQSLRA